MLSAANDSHEAIPLVPPQLPPFLASVFNLKPILSDPSREEVKLVHEAIRALNNFPQTSGLRNTDLSMELSQHLFDIQMVCHRQKYPTSALPNDVVYDPPTLPAYIPVELKPVNGPPSNEEVASVHTALRISESFANVPASIFDPNLHVQLSQHLFDIQLARHIQRSIVKRLASVTSVAQRQTVLPNDPGDTNANSNTPPSTTSQIVETMETQNPPVDQSGTINQPISRHNPSASGELRKLSELMIEIRDTLKSGNRILVGTQNSLARGFNATSYHGDLNRLTSDMGAHSLINDHGEVPEACNLPTFKYTGHCQKVSLAIDKLTDDELARYLRFYGIGEDMIEEGDSLKIKSGMQNDARAALSRRLFLNRR
ncbi:hypothetical protein RSOLAG22IIIB_07500 [Rhizoctonia solani]|uniref:Laminin domain protein n=1 Tax=Rhizoctonia solani TaxID=456999 RepID=A0A0K6FNE8_9AGAM|nr:hypothetical protein RSOLAG22IIIB_07500 [Rhizoctonia solani]